MDPHPKSGPRPIQHGWVPDACLPSPAEEGGRWRLESFNYQSPNAKNESGGSGGRRERLGTGGWMGWRFWVACVASNLSFSFPPFQASSTAHPKRGTYGGPEVKRLLQGPMRAGDHAATIGASLGRWGSTHRPKRSLLGSPTILTVTLKSQATRV